MELIALVLLVHFIGIGNAALALLSMIAAYFVVAILVALLTE